MPVFLLTFVEGFLGPYAKFAKPLIYAMLALILVGGLFGLKSCYDHKIIAAANNKQDASSARADTQADSTATNQIIIDNGRRTSESQETQHAIDHAKQTGADPRAAYYDCVRKQQSARRTGQPSPSC